MITASSIVTGDTMLKVEECGQGCNSDNCKQYCDVLVTVATLANPEACCNSDNCKQYCDALAINAEPSANL